MTADDDFRPTGSRRGEVLGCLGVVVAVGLVQAVGSGLVLWLIPLTPSGAHRPGYTTPIPLTTRPAGARQSIPAGHAPRTL